MFDWVLSTTQVPYRKLKRNISFNKCWHLFVVIVLSLLRLSLLFFNPFNPVMLWKIDIKKNKERNFNPLTTNVSII